MESVWKYSRYRNTGCYNRNIIDWVTNGKHLSVVFLEAGKSKIKVPVLSSEGPLHGLQTAISLLSPHRVESKEIGNKLPPVSYPIHEVSTRMT